MLGVSLSSCHRYHPATVERSCQSDFDLPCCLRPKRGGSAFGTDSRGHLCVHFRYGPMTRNLPCGGLVGRLHELSLPLPCYPSYRASDYYSGRTDSCRTHQPSLDTHFFMPYISGSGVASFPLRPCTTARQYEDLSGPDVVRMRVPGFLTPWGPVPPHHYGVTSIAFGHADSLDTPNINPFDAQ